MAPPLDHRKTQFELEVLSKLDSILAAVNTAGGNPAIIAALSVIEDHMRYMRISDMRRYGQVGDPAALPPAFDEQP